MRPRPRNPTRALVEDLGRLVQATLAHWGEIARVHDLHVTDVRAIALLRQVGTMRPSEMAKAMALSESGTTAMLHRLRKAGLIARRQGFGKGYSIEIDLIDGAAKRLALAPTHQAVAAITHGELDDASIEAFAALVAGLAHSIEEASRILRGDAPPPEAPELLLPYWS